jgi:hypothetical protein
MRFDEVVSAARKLGVSVRANGTLGEISVNRKGAAPRAAVYAKTAEEAWRLAQEMSAKAAMSSAT